jgi:putative DNA primase/helicase
VSGAADRAGDYAPDRASARRGAPRAAPRLDDNYLVDEVAKEHGDGVRYCPAEKRWYLWDGRRWAPDATRAIETCVRTTLDRIAVDLERRVTRGQRAQAATLRGRANSIRSPRAIATTVNGLAGTGVASTGARISVALSSFDDPKTTASLLNCANGVLDLRSMELSPHTDSMGLLITRLCPVRYMPSAECPEFESALNRLFMADRDPALARTRIEALQSALGYSLTGEQSWHAIFVLHGEQGNNGKSFLMKIIQNVLGCDYTTTLHHSVLLRGRGEQHPTGLMSLRGRRFAVATEFSERDAFDSALLKRLSGDDEVSARLMHQDFESFQPTHHLWIATNKLPVVDRKDNAFVRRFIVFPFDRHFVRRDDPSYQDVLPVDREDEGLAERILAREREGVLAWMLRGLVRYRAVGASTSPISIIAQAATSLPLSAVESWLEECCELPPASTEHQQPDTGLPWETPCADLRESFMAWCVRRHAPILTPTAFGRRLTGLGFPERKIRGKHCRVGIALRRESSCEHA